jgi:DNA polymerase III epsilon subunit-like protein
VANAPAFVDIKGEVLRVLEDAILVAHNAHVDVKAERKVVSASA